MLHGHAGGNSQTLEKVELLSNVDYVILAPCGFSIERTYDELKAINLLQTKEWQDLPPVKNRRVAISDGNKYFNRSSVASILATTEIVAEIIYQELRGMFGHHGAKWVLLDELSSYCSRKGAEPPRKEIVLAQGLAGLESNKNGLDKKQYSKDSDAIQHVRRQIAALQLGDYKAAYLMNSPANQKRLVTAEKFEAIVSGSSSFKLLTLVNIFCDYHDGTVNGAVANVKVNAKAGENTVLNFIFDLRKNEDGETWETDGVRIDC